MPEDLATRAANLILTLPERHPGLSAQQADTLAALWEAIANASAAMAEASQRIVDLLVERGAPPEAAVLDYLSPAEVAAYESQARTTLDAERAASALEEWARRSGAPLPETTRPMTVAEDPDGAITLLWPAPPSSERRPIRAPETPR